MKNSGGWMHNQNGNALISVVVAGAILLTVVLGALQVVNNMTKSMVIAEGTLEAANQLYIARSQLSDPETCTLNLRNITIPSGTVAITTVLREKNPLGGVLSQTPLFPQGESNRVTATRFNISRSPSSPQIGVLQIGFERRGEGLSLHRNIPLTIVTDAAGVISACTAGDPASLGTPRSSTGENCDQAFEQDPETRPYFAAARTAVNSICNSLTYPTAKRQFRVYRAGGACPGGYICVPPSASLQEGFHVRVAQGSSMWQHPQDVLGPGFEDLSSATECMSKVPAVPAGGGFKYSTVVTNNDGVVSFQCNHGKLWKSFTQNLHPWVPY